MTGAQETEGNLHEVKESLQVIKENLQVIKENLLVQDLDYGQLIFLKFYFAVRVRNLSIDWLMEYLFWIIRVCWANRVI
jgi:hypothetical protein